MIQEFDHALFTFCHQSLRNPFFDTFFRMVESPLWSNVVILTFALIFIFRERKRFPVLAFGLSFLVPLFLSGWLKKFFNRPRPLAQANDMLFSIHAQSSSFPSQHSCIIMAMAVVLSYHYPRYTFWFYLIAGLVGFSRVYLGLHYLTDILVGYLLGAVAGFAILRLEKRLVRSPAVKQSNEK